MKTLAKTLLYLIIAANVADAVTSYIAIDNQWADEANPFGATAISHLGLGLAIVLYKLPILAFCWFIHGRVSMFCKSAMRAIPLVGVSAFFVFVLFNNLTFFA